MFIRTSYKISGKSKKKYSYLTLVESFSTEKGPRQRIIISLPRIDLPKDQWPIFVEMIKRRLAGQALPLTESPSLSLVADTTVERIRRKGSMKAAQTEGTPAAKETVSGIKVSLPRTLGPILVAEEVWQKLSMKVLLQKCGMSAHEIPLCTLEVFKWLTPQSDRSAPWILQTAINDLWQQDIPETSVETFYPLADRLLTEKKKLYGLLSRQDEAVFGVQDAVHLYYAIDAPDFPRGEVKPESIPIPMPGSLNRDKGYRKRVVGMVLNQDGFVKIHEAHSGNEEDFTTRLELAERLRDRIGEGALTPTVVIDRKMASEENLTELKKRDFYYAIVQKRRGDDYSSFPFVAEGIEESLLSFTSAGLGDITIKRTKEAAYILSGETDETPTNEGLTERVKGAIGRFTPWRKPEGNQDRDNEDYLFKTSHLQLSDDLLWKQYRMLVRLRGALRHLTPPPGLNSGLSSTDPPKRWRIEDGQIFMMVLAYRLLHAIEYFLKKGGDFRHWAQIKQILQTHQVVSATLLDPEGEQTHHLSVATEPSPEQKEIYRKLGITVPPIQQKKITLKTALI